MMRTIPTVLALLVLTASAGTANAQSEATARAALQRAVVVEEQEHDLVTAAKLYREVARDAVAAEHAQVRGEALLRLGELLLRLGKDDEARASLEQAAALGGEIGDRAEAALRGQGQEGEREQKLREKARGILEKLFEEYNRLYRKWPGMQGSVEALPGVPDFQAVQDLLWIGQPAVPEVLRLLEKYEAIYAEGIRNDKGTEASDLYLANVTRYASVQWEITGLMALLWKLGGEQAARYLERIQQHELLGMRRAAAHGALVAEDPRMLRVAEGFLLDPDPEGKVPIAILSLSLTRPFGSVSMFNPRPHDLNQSLRVRAIVDLLDNEIVAVRVHVLDLLRSQWPQLAHDPDPAATSELLVPKLRNVLQDLDPQVGQAAQRMLVSHVPMLTAAGRSLVLEWIPKIDENLHPALLGEWPKTLPPDGTAHLEEILRTARALGPVETQPYGPYERLPGRHHVLQQLLQQIVPTWGSDAVLGVLELVRLGYESRGNAWLSGWLSDKAQDSDLLALARSLQIFPEPGPIVRRLADRDLPAEAWPHLKEYAASRGRLGQDDLEAIGWTGTDAAAEFLIEHLRANPDYYHTTVWGLLDLSHKNRSEVVRAALREALVMSAADPAAPRIRNAVFARLAQLGDEAAVEMFPRAYEQGLITYLPHNAPPDYGSGNRRGIQWLAPLHDGSSFHGYDQQQLVRAWQVLLADREVEEQVWDDAMAVLFQRLDSSKTLSVGTRIYTMRGAGQRPARLVAVPRPVLDLVASTVSARAGEGLAEQSEVVATAIHTIAGALSAATSNGTDFPARYRRTWTARMLSHEEPTLRLVVLENLPGSAARMLQDEVEKRLEDEHHEISWAALQALIRAEVPIEEDLLGRLLASSSSRVRESALNAIAPRVGAAALPLVLPLLEDPAGTIRAAACAFLGSNVQTDAVPPLLQALRDPDKAVREAAAAALEQIRFYHDQKGHWARVFQGVDTSSNAAAEKLLLQAKPDQPRDTRLMAIRSLGALGVPEALPFLIDYTTSEDEDLARAARDAITAIHRKAGVK